MVQAKTIHYICDKVHDDEDEESSDGRSKPGSRRMNRGSREKGSPSRHM